MCKKDITDKPTALSDANATDTLPPSDELAGIHQILADLQEHFGNQIARNQNQMKMFDAMYGEMKGYKENFLLEALHKPVIQNLIQLYDSFVELESQCKDMLGKRRKIQPKKLSKQLQQFHKNLENALVELVEVLYRMDVTPYESGSEKLEPGSEKLDRKLHKTLDVVPTADPEKDQTVAEVHKTGFYWREKVFRPEEVTIYRYTPAKTGKEKK